MNRNPVPLRPDEIAPAKAFKGRKVNYQNRKARRERQERWEATDRVVQQLAMELGDGADHVTWRGTRKEVAALASRLILLTRVNLVVTRDGTGIAQAKAWQLCAWPHTTEPPEIT